MVKTCAIQGLAELAQGDPNFEAEMRFAGTILAHGYARDEGPQPKASQAVPKTKEEPHRVARVLQPAPNTVAWENQTKLMPQALVSGSFRNLFLYDLCEEIRLDELRKLLGSPLAGREPGFRHLAPEYVRFERPPVVETLDPVLLENDAPRRCTINYYDYGVVSIEFEATFEVDWPRLVKSVGTWMTAPEVEKKAAEVVRRCQDRVGPALVKPYDYQLTEDYYIVQIRPLADEAAL